MLNTPQGANVDFPHVTGLSSSKQGMGGNTSYNNNASSNWSAKNGGGKGQSGSRGGSGGSGDSNNANNNNNPGTGAGSGTA